MNRIMVHSSEVCVKAVCFIPSSPFIVPSDFTYCSSVFPSSCICTHQLAEKLMLTKKNTKKTNTHEERTGLNGL